MADAPVTQIAPIFTMTVASHRLQRGRDVGSSSGPNVTRYGSCFSKTSDGGLTRVLGREVVDCAFFSMKTILTGIKSQVVEVPVTADERGCGAR